MTAEELDKLVNTLRSFVVVESEVEIEQKIKRLIYALESINRIDLAKELDKLVREIDRIPTEDIIRQGTFK